MEKRILGKTGLSVSVLGFGGAEIGFEELSDDDVSSILNQALDSGINVIDTAAAYLKSESLIGKSIGHRRKEFNLITKCGAIEGFTKSDWSKDGILRTVENSLKNLKTDNVDILMLHSCGELEMAWGEALDGVEAAKEKGYARYIGYSGDGSAALWAVKSGCFDVFETSLSIVDQEAIRLTLPFAKAENLGVIIKRPLGNAAWRYKEAPENEYHLPYWTRLQALKYRFLNDPNVNPASLALRFTLSQPGVHCAIVGTAKPKRFKENLELLKEGPLPQAEIDYITNRWRETAQIDWLGQI